MKARARTPRYYEKQNAVITLLIAIPFFAIVLFIIQSRTIQLGGQIINSIQTNHKVVALTFDDGPEVPHSDELLAILEEQDVKATFFLIGVEMERYPEATKRLATSGHEIGNHSYSHSSMIFMSPDSIAREVETTDTLIRQAGYKGMIPFRPPYMHKFIGLPAYLAQHQRPTIAADISLDQNGKKDRHKITQEVLKRVQPGSIILFHAMYDHTTESRAALPEVIQGLKSQGYTFVTMSELLKYQ